MPLIINQQRADQDSWNYIGGELSDADLSARLQSQGGDLLVDWAVWKEYRQQLLSRDGQLGVRIDGFVELEELAPELERLALIAIDFPAFSDGRGFSQARQLRQQYDYKGQLRAVGDVTWDRLRFMGRCGFDAFEIAEDRYSDDMLGAFAEISVRLQGSVDDPRPIYRQ